MPGIPWESGTLSVHNLRKTKTCSDKMKLPLHLQFQSGATPITNEQAALFLSPEDIAKGEQRAKHSIRMPWGFTISLSALAISHNFETGALIVWGHRQLSKPREDGYCMAGGVSVAGKTKRAFTSSMLFELPDGKLVDVAIIHVCSDKASVAA